MQIIVLTVVDYRFAVYVMILKHNNNGYAEKYGCLFGQAIPETGDVGGIHFMDFVQTIKYVKTTRLYVDLVMIQLKTHSMYILFTLKWFEMSKHFRQVAHKKENQHLQQ